MKWTIELRGTRHSWIVRLSEGQAKAMAEDGFEVREVVNIIPALIVNLGLSRVWCAAQDVFNSPSRWLRK